MPLDIQPNARTAFLTGATGFVGANLVRELLDRGWIVKGTRRANSNLFRIAKLDIELAPADIGDLDSLEAAIPLDVDAVFHLAADLRLSDRATEAQVETNVQGTRNLLAAAKTRRARKVILVSSMAAFGLWKERIDESARSNARDIPIGYFRSKYLAELEAERAVADGLDVTIVNPANVVGPFDVANMPATFIRLVAQSAMPVTTTGRASFCHARAISAAFVNAVDCGRTGERYLLGGADSTFADLGRLVADITGGTAPRILLPRYTTLEEAADVTRYAETYGLDFLTPEIALAVSSDMLIDDAKAQRELDYAPATLRRMVCDEVNWLRDHGLVRPICHAGLRSSGV